MFKKGQLVRSKETGATYVIVDFFWDYSWFVMVQSTATRVAPFPMRPWAVELCSR